MFSNKRNQTTPPMRVDKAFKELVRDASAKAKLLEKMQVSEREITRRLGQSDKIKLLLEEDSKLRAKKKNDY